MLLFSIEKLLPKKEGDFWSKIVLRKKGVGAFWSKTAFMKAVLWLPSCGNVVKVGEGPAKEASKKEELVTCTIRWKSRKVKWRQRVQMSRSHHNPAFRHSSSII